MKHFGIVGAGLIPLVFFIVSLGTTEWVTYSSGVIKYQTGLFRYHAETPTSTDGDVCSDDDSSVNGNSACDKIRTARAFIIMAVILVAGALALSFLKRGRIAAATWGAAGLFGLIGWAVFYGGYQEGDLTNGSSYDIGYSQALAIVAWVLSLVLAGASFVLLD
eukprot:m.223619 g.223619  ORF g.223619 m.223619 type:complete len:163 (-) comp10952_c0_seq1:52-540(-)